MARVLPREAVEVINRLFRDIDHPNFDADHSRADRLAVVLEAVEAVPPELVQLDSAGYVEFLAGRAAIKETLGIWRSLGGTRTLGRLPGFDANPLLLLRNALAGCPDEVVSPGTTDLPFLNQESEWQEELRLDIHRAERALANSEWKAATVLAGSVIEALLLWALDKKGTAATNAKKAPNRPLDEWYLPDYFAVAVELEVLTTEETIKEVDITKSYRNLIHPGRARRKKQRCDKGTARTALAAVEHVGADLTKHFPAP